MNEKVTSNVVHNNEAIFTIRVIKFKSALIPIVLDELLWLCELIGLLLCILISLWLCILISFCWLRL